MLIGEPETYGYATLQREIGRLIHGEAWDTREIPKPLAKTGAWLEEAALPKDKEPCIKPWMIDFADDHYEIDISRARELLGWEPRHRLIDSLPDMVHRLESDPPGWYERNKLHVPDEIEGSAESPSRERETVSAGAHASKPAGGDEKMLVEEHLGTLWAQFACLLLGLWLLASPFALGYFTAHGADPQLLRVTAERHLSAPDMRAAFMGWSDAITGAVVTVLSLLAISPRRRFPWAQWVNAAAGFWLLFAPLAFWSPLAVAYVNDSLVGALLIALLGADSDDARDEHGRDDARP